MISAQRMASVLFLDSFRAESVGGTAECTCVKAVPRFSNSGKSHFRSLLDILLDFCRKCMLMLTNLPLFMCNDSPVLC